MFTNINILDSSPIGCSMDVSFYTTLVVHTTFPMAAVIALLIARRYTSAKLGTQCATAAFYILFFIYPSVTAKIFTTFNCVTFDDEFDGSDSFLRVDLSISCNAPERAGWLAYAIVACLVYPIGVPLFYAYLLLVRHRTFLQHMRSAEKEAQ